MQNADGILIGQMAEFQGTPWSNESDPNMPEGDTNAPDATTYNICRLAAQFTIYSYDKRTTFRIKQILIEDIAVEETFELRLSFILYGFKEKNPQPY